jgi:hypothetical protein
MFEAATVSLGDVTEHHHPNPRFFGSAHTISGSARFPHRKREAHISTRVNHLLIADWTRRFSVLLPISEVNLYGPTHFFGYPPSN